MRGYNDDHYKTTSILGSFNKHKERLILEMIQQAPLVYSPEDLIRMINIHNGLPWVDFGGNDLFNRFDKTIPDFKFPGDDDDER